MTAIPPLIPPSGNFTTLSADLASMFDANMTDATVIDASIIDMITVGNSDTNAWHYTTKLGFSTGTQFGYSVSLHGNNLYVGRISSNTVYVYQLVNNIWTQITSLVPTDMIGGAQFGYSISSSSIGTTQYIAVGGLFDNSSIGAVWIYQGLNGGSLPSDWSEVTKIIPTDEIGTATFGISVSLVTVGSAQTLAIGGANDNSGVGAVWIYKQSGSTWNEIAKIMPSDNIGTSGFGSSVSLSYTAATTTYYLCIGGPFDNSSVGAFWIYSSSNGTSWSEVVKIVPSDVIGASRVGTCVSLLSDTTSQTAVISGPFDNTNIGAVWVYHNTGSGWTEVTKIVNPLGSVTTFGIALALTSQDSIQTAIIGTTGAARAVFVYQGISSVWTEVTQINPVNHDGQGNFGNSLAIIPKKDTTSDTLSTTNQLVAAIGADLENLSFGSVYMYDYSPMNTVINDESMVIPNSLVIGQDTFLSGNYISSDTVVVTTSLQVNGTGITSTDVNSNKITTNHYSFINTDLEFSNNFATVDTTTRQGFIDISNVTLATGVVSSEMTVNNSQVSTQSIVLVQMYNTAVGTHNFSVNVTSVSSGSFNVNICNVGPSVVSAFITISFWIVN